MRATNWTTKTDLPTVMRRAAGRDRHNQRRKRLALVRLGLVLSELANVGFGRGHKSEIARRLGVDRSTVCRDLKTLNLLERGYEPWMIDLIRRDWHQSYR